MLNATNTYKLLEYCFSIDKILKKEILENIKMLNEFKFTSLKVGMCVVLTKDMVHLDTSVEAQEENVFQGQLGCLYGVEADNKSTSSYIVIFYDMNNRNPDDADLYITKLELQLNDTIPLILPYPKRVC